MQKPVKNPIKDLLPEPVEDPLRKPTAADFRGLSSNPKFGQRMPKPPIFTITFLVEGFRFLGLEALRVRV